MSGCWAKAVRSGTGSSARASHRSVRTSDPERAGAVDERPGVEPYVAVARRLLAVLRERGLTLATAESCTGGLLGHVLTEVPGASDAYVGGVVSYSNQVKEKQLGVPRVTLERHGAVSAQTAVAMADGARREYGASVGVGITGIAGPDGGTPSKPVGLTYVAVADETGHDVRRYVWAGDRSGNKRESVGASLELVLDRLSGT